MSRPPATGDRAGQTARDRSGQTSADGARQTGEDGVGQTGGDGGGQTGGDGAEQDERFGPLTGWSRLLRVGVLGSAGMLLATGAHLVGGGRLPSAGLLLVTTFLVGLVAVTVTARRCRLRLLLPLLAAEQVGLHLLFGAADSGAACHPAAAHAAHPAGTALGCVPADPMTMAAPGWSMWLSHLLAAALTAWVLTRAEAALWALADRVVRVATATPGARPSRRRPLPATSLFPAVVAVLLSRAAARAPPVTARPG